MNTPASPQRDSTADGNRRSDYLDLATVGGKVAAVRSHDDQTMLRGDLTVSPYQVSFPQTRSRYATAEHGKPALGDGQVTGRCHLTIAQGWKIYASEHVCRRNQRNPQYLKRQPENAPNGPPNTVLASDFSTQMRQTRRNLVPTQAIASAGTIKHSRTARGAANGLFVHGFLKHPV